MNHTPRIKAGHAPDQPTPPHIFSDHEWVRQHENELRDRYGEVYVVVYQQQVYGVGRTYPQALADAEAHLPPDITEIEVMVESLHCHPPITAFWPAPEDKFV
ncbi:MAG: hypothetical protein BroJett018_52790 [Chloroflexota bacterium]|nr:MAG: hypothetical protein BroJett018_52790 [Chloroflexota bacterium]